MKITIIGTGNIAYHLGKRFIEKGIEINQIVGRNKENARQLAALFKASFTIDFRNIKTDSDLYIIAVSDDAIVEVAKKISKNIDNQLVVHTSGAVPSNVLQPFFKNYGSLYPLQTFSLNSQPDFEKIPIFYNTHSFRLDIPFKFGFECLLEKAALYLSPNVYHLSDEGRTTLHIAAVFVNNFTNYLYSVSEDILQKGGLPFDILKPLIAETVKKIEKNAPKDMQTGPAKRGDIETIEKHLQYLQKHTPQYLDLYKLITNHILEK